MKTYAHLSIGLAAGALLITSSLAVAQTTTPGPKDQCNGPVTNSPASQTVKPATVKQSVQPSANGGSSNQPATTAQPNQTTIKPSAVNSKPVTPHQ
ncbi:MAG TPA: hypothetical protein VH117_10140 [Edaphobacter sp.]|nr:hypothetical protein [Edaphobacter sp.]